MTDHIKQKTDNDLFVRSLMDSIQQQETYERKQRKQEEKQIIKKVVEKKIVVEKEIHKQMNQLLLQII